MYQANLQRGTSKHLYEAIFYSIILDILVLEFNICWALFPPLPR